MTEYFSEDFHQINVELAERSASILGALLQNDTPSLDDGFTTENYSTTIGRELGHWTTYNRILVEPLIHSSIFKNLEPPDYLHDRLFQLSLSLVALNNSTKAFAHHQLPHDKNGFRNRVNTIWMNAIFDSADYIELFCLSTDNKKISIEMCQKTTSLNHDRTNTPSWELWISRKADRQIVPSIRGTITLARTT